MKHYFIIVIATLLCSCSNTIELDKQISHDEGLNITAPNGQKISESISILKEEIAYIVAEKNEIDRMFDITYIEYIQVDNGYLAVIHFAIDDKTNGAIVKTNIDVEMGDGLEIREKSGFKRMQTRNEIEVVIDGRTHYISCEDTNTCKCTPSVDTRNGSVKITCPGNNCSCRINARTNL